MTIDGPLSNVCIGPDATVHQALEAIDRGAAAIALVISEGGRLQGVVTDGDIRRGLLNGAVLESKVLEFASSAPRVVGPDATRASVLDLMRSLRISEIPVVDGDGRLLGLHTLTDIVGRRRLTNKAVIMAGGKGTRLGALTKDTPKPLMTVADRTIIEWIILGLVESGITDIYVSVAHLAHKIIEHLGDGAHLGCRISYLHEDPAKPLNTAGALGLLRHQVKDLSEPVIVTNADLMVRYSAADLLDFHRSKNASVTVAARPYSHQVPFGVLEIGEGRRIESVVEKPTIEFEISTGIYAVSPEALDLIPYMEPFSMPDLVNACLEDSKTVAAWPVDSDWIDVGTPKDLAIAKGQ
ncbi:MULTISPECIES: nucleotidyltransferase family protein [Arthrobacter]|uniref:Nucleotidyltransferase family protein n=2 Tax=Arthrobacter TaxID=1663 RepID=A0ABU9KLV6_9MICC|nr:nucleotidyltransferase family protein [Arthrobacter sp. YJM1]MDP5227248.1 nucleotidyltransferase family protein [Arthrobacter sp. YJM1]